MQGPPSTSGCLPPGYGENTIYYQSVCPLGYTKACTSLQTVLETTSVLEFGTYTLMTVQICCPTRFVLFSLPFVLEIIFTFLSTPLALYAIPNGSLIINQLWVASVDSEQQELFLSLCPSQAQPHLKLSRKVLQGV
jgi:hypothetical protein